MWGIKQVVVVRHAALGGRQHVSGSGHHASIIGRQAVGNMHQEADVEHQGSGEDWVKNNYSGNYL